MKIREINILDDLITKDGWIRDGCYCKKEIYSDRLVGLNMPYLIGYIVIDVNTLEISTELNDFYNPIYIKKEFDEKTQTELKELKYLTTDVEPISKRINPVITLNFELLKNGYKLISDITLIDGITFTGEDLTNEVNAIGTQEKLEYIFYKERNKIELKKYMEELNTNKDE